MSYSFPLQCQRCGLAFFSNGFSFSGHVENTTFLNCKETCPRCSSWVNLDDGTYDIHVIADGIANVMKHSADPHGKALQLLDLANRIRETDNLSLIHQSPELVALLDRMGTRKESKNSVLQNIFFISMILSSMATTLHHTGMLPSTIEAIKKAIYALLN